MRRLGCVLGPLLAVGCPGGATADAPSPVPVDPCIAVRKAVDARASAKTPPDVLLRLGPHFSVKALDRLLAVGRKGTIDHRLAAYGAFGLSRYASGLRMLAKGSFPADDTGRLAYAIASFALGNGTYSTTVADALLQEPTDRRRAAVEIVSRMRHARARRMLLPVLEDTDAHARLVAAEALVRYRSRRARRTLEAFVREGPDSLRPRAAEALIAAKHRFDDETLELMGPDLAARAIARVSRRSPLADLDPLLVDPDPGVRAGAWATAIAHADATDAWWAEAVEKSGDKFEALGRGERGMAAALFAAEDRPLVPLEGPARTGALRVLSAYGELWTGGGRIAQGTSMLVIAALEAWWPALETPEQARALISVAAVDPALGVRLTRKVLPRASAPVVLAAAEVLRRHGTPDDSRALVAAASGPATIADGAALAAAARLCGLEPR